MIGEVIIIILLIAIAITIDFVIKLILKKLKVGKPKRRILISNISAMVLSPLVLYGIFFTYIIQADYHPNYKFDKDEWMSNTEERYEMSKNIIESEMLIGKTKEQVKSLLGNFDFTYKDNHWAYDIGFAPSLFNIDPSVLDVYFEDGKVKKVTQHET